MSLAHKSSLTPLPPPGRTRIQPSVSASARRLAHEYIARLHLPLARPVEVRARPRAAGDGLVVLVDIIAEGEIIHGALRGSQHTERAVERVGDRLRRLDIAGDDGGGIARGQHRAFGNDDINGLETA